MTIDRARLGVIIIVRAHLESVHLTFVWRLSPASTRSSPTINISKFTGCSFRTRCASVGQDSEELELSENLGKKLLVFAMWLAFSATMVDEGPARQFSAAKLGEFP
jgi:hypothetical protein